MMQIFNEINSRKVHGERQVFSGIFTNPIFVAVIVGTFVVQVFLIEFGSIIFSTHPLSLSEWLWCLFWGFGVLVWHQIIAFIPISVIPKSMSFGKSSIETPVPDMDEADDGMDRTDSRAELKRAQILWMRGLNRLQQQIRVVHAFQSGLQHRIEHKNINNSFNQFMSPPMGESYDIDAVKKDEDSAPTVSFHSVETTL